MEIRKTGGKIFFPQNATYTERSNKEAPLLHNFHKSDCINTLPLDWQEVIIREATLRMPSLRDLINADHNWCGLTCDSISHNIPELKICPEQDGSIWKFNSFGTVDYSHVWLEDGSGTIIDPTAAQFMIDGLEDILYFQKNLGVPVFDSKEEIYPVCWVLDKEHPLRKLYLYS